MSASSVHSPLSHLPKPAYERHCRSDWQRIAQELQQGCLPTPTRHIIYAPNVVDLERFMSAAQSTPDAPLAFDIERPAGTTRTIGKPTKTHPTGKVTMKKDYRAGKIVCISFSLNPYTNTITIPTDAAYWKTRGFTGDIWDWIRALLHLPNPKVTQNGLYDFWHLADYGITPANWAYDTLYLHHALNCRDQHSLHHMSSIYLRTQYWKDEAKESDGVAGWTAQQERLREYCGKDSAHTLELLYTFLPQFDQQSWARYIDHYWSLYGPLLAMMRRGLQVDIPEAKKRRALLHSELSMLRSGIKGLTGQQLMAAKALSTTKLKTYLYRTLQLPEQYKGRGRAKTVTTDEVAIKRLANQYPDRFPEAVSSALLRTRRVLKLMEAYEPKHFDKDGRMRSTYSPATNQGRLLSKRNPGGSGTNGQNIDAEARQVYVADEGMVMVIVDLSQAESRVNRCYIYSLTGDEETYRKATAAPGTWDDHNAMASRIFNTTDPAEIKQHRPLGKMIVHASQRKMQGETLAERVLKKRGEVILPDDANRLIKRAIDAQPGLLDYFHWVDFQVQHHRVVTSTWGVPMRFTYDRLGGDIYREAYSFLMQDAVGRLTNQYGMRWLWDEEPTAAWKNGRMHLNAQWHDGLLMSIPKDPVFIADTVAGLMRSLARPRSYNGVELCMPSEVKIGLDTAGTGGAEFQHPPTVEDVQAVLNTLNTLEHTTQRRTTPHADPTTTTP